MFDTLDAQRRPGREPRRHLHHVLELQRMARPAQRRPGREPRRHRGGAPAARAEHRALNEGRGANPGDTARRTPARIAAPGRSTKAGARTPATRRGLDAGGTAGPSLNEGRGANPGDTLTARSPALPPSALNEGRGANPGDTPVAVQPPTGTLEPAQRRPGREPRRHAGASGAFPLYLPRSTKAGARTPATPSTSA